MSMTTVHHNTMYTGAVVGTTTAYATVNPANGLIWTFRLNAPSPRSDQDFSWAFPPNGTPTPQTVENPTAVTYATAGSKTATVTVTNTSRTVSNKALTSNVATLTTTAAHGFAVGQSVVVSGVDATFNGTYTILATPSGTTFTYAKTAADVVSAASGGTVTSDPAQVPVAGAYNITVTAVSGVAPLLAEQQSTAPDTTAEAPYDPADHTVAEVMAYVDENPDQVDEVLAAEEAGRARATLLNQLRALI